MYNISFGAVPGAQSNVSPTVTQGQPSCQAGYKLFWGPGQPASQALCTPTQQVQPPVIKAPLALVMRQTTGSDGTTVPPPSVAPKPVLRDNQLVCPEGFYVVDPIRATAICLPSSVSSQPIQPCPTGTHTAYESIPTGYQRVCVQDTGAAVPADALAPLPPEASPARTPWLWAGLAVAVVAGVGGLAVAFAKKRS